MKKLRVVLPVIILTLIVALPIKSQPFYTKPAKRKINLLLDQGVFLKTECSFSAEDSIVPYLFTAVFDRGHKVYDPNFWGSVPEILRKDDFEVMDTTDILKYMHAGWDSSYLVDESGNWESFPTYRHMDQKEITGLFFMESWWMDSKSHRLYKDIIAYSPVRQYQQPSQENDEEFETLKRLVFLVIPDKSFDPSAKKRYKPSDFKLLKSGLEYEVNLYNKPYQKYIYREDYDSGVQEKEYLEWQYHYFDFYRHFRPDDLLRAIIVAVLEGNLQAYGEGNTVLSRNDFIQNLTGYAAVQSLQIETLSGMFPLDELNSIVFKEDWYINPENLLIYKDVKSLTAIRYSQQLDSYSGEFIRETRTPAFTIKFY